MSTPARLHKVEEKSEFEQFLLRNSHIFVPILMIILVVLILIIVGIILKNVSAVSAVESGNYYYHLQDVI